MIKILHLLSSDSYSGAENVVFQICTDKRLKENYKFIYCSPQGSIAQNAKERSIQYVGIERMSRSDLKKVVNSIEPDIIHAHDPKAIMYATSLFLKKVPLIFHIHTNLNTSLANKLKGILLYIVSSFSSSIIWVSHQNYQNYFFRNFSKIKQKSVVLENTISREYYLKSKKNKDEDIEKDIDIIFLGRFEDVKNPMRAIKIIEKVIAIDSSIKAFLVGDGSLMSEMKEYVKSRKLESNITFTGNVSNPIDYLMRSKIFLMTSIYEGRPMAALEAMMCCNYIVSTPTDGIIDLVKPPVNGFLSENDEELMESIVHYLSNYNKKHSLPILKEFHRVNDYSGYVKKIDSLYEKSVRKGLGDKFERK